MSAPNPDTGITKGFQWKEKEDISQFSIHLIDATENMETDLTINSTAANEKERNFILHEIWKIMSEIFKT